jgi:VWFA-related protein
MNKIAAVVFAMASMLVIRPMFEPSSAQAAQTAQQASDAIRVRVRLIPVDVVATDASGRPVANLKQEDFQVFENGREQEIRHFSVEKLAAAVPNTANPPRLRSVPTLELAPRSARTFLILLGRGRHQTYFKCVDNLIRFVKKDLLPQDRLAVFAYNRATDFTTDHEKIARLLERYKRASEKLESLLNNQFSGLAAIYGSKQIPKAIQSEIDRIFTGEEALSSRRVPQQPIPDKAGWDAQGHAVAGEANRSEDASKISAFDNVELITGGLSFDQFASASAMTQQDTRNILTCIEYLRYMEGEKHLVLFTEKGLFFPRGDMKYDIGIASVANDARVAVDIFHTGGVPPIPLQFRPQPPKIEIGPGGSVTVVRPDPPPFSQSNPPAETNAIQSIRTVADLTGGRVAIFTDVGQALSTLNETTRVQYLLGYYPKDENWDGKFRQIRVTVRRPGIKLSYRHGYFARDTVRPYDPDELLAYSRISAAAGYEGDIPDIPLKVYVSSAPDASGQIKTRIDLTLDAKYVGFKRVNDRQAARLRIVVFAFEGNDRLLDEDWKIMDLQLLPETYRNYLEFGIPYTLLLDSSNARRAIKVVVYDPETDKLGSKTVKIGKQIGHPFSPQNHRQ